MTSTTELHRFLDRIDVNQGIPLEQTLNYEWDTRGRERIDSLARIRYERKQKVVYEQPKQLLATQTTALVKYEESVARKPFAQKRAASALVRRLYFTEPNITQREPIVQERTLEEYNQINRSHRPL